MHPGPSGEYQQPYVYDKSDDGHGEHNFVKFIHQSNYECVL